MDICRFTMKTKPVENIRDDIDAPLWDLNSFSGRLRHFAWVTDYRQTIVPRRKFDESKEIIQKCRLALLLLLLTRTLIALKSIVCMCCEVQKIFQEWTVSSKLDGQRIALRKEVVWIGLPPRLGRPSKCLWQNVISNAWRSGYNGVHASLLQVRPELLLLYMYSFVIILCRF